jgi:hypothetical protein
MKRNTLLYLALLLSKSIRAFLILGLVLLIVVFIHWHWDRDYYKSVQVSAANGAISFLEGKTDDASSLKAGVSGKYVYLNDLKPYSVYFTFFQLILSIIVSCFIIREVIRILRSVQKMQPFIEQNIKSFTRIGYLCLSILVLNSLHFIITSRSSFISFSINYTLLICMLITFILAEIFKEGLILYEQEKLTI